MRIEAVTSTGRPEPQFVVHAETKEDQIFLRTFLTMPDHSKDDLIFFKHGDCMMDGEFISFNFGWTKKAAMSKTQLLAKLIHNNYVDDHSDTAEILKEFMECESE